MTTTMATIRLIAVGLRGIGHDFVLGSHGAFLRALNGRFHQVRGLRGGLHRAVDDNVVLQLLRLDGLFVGGQEALDDRGQRTDHDQQIAVVGLATQLVENVLQRGLGLGHRRDQAGIARSAESPGRRPQRVYLGIGQKQQPFDLEAIVQLGQRRRSQLGVERLGPFIRNRRALVDLRKQGDLRLGKVFHGGGKALHQGFYLLQPLPGIRPWAAASADFQFLRFARLEPLQVGNGLFDLGRRSGQPDVAGGELNLAQVDMRRERVVGHLSATGRRARLPVRCSLR